MSRRDLVALVADTDTEQVLHALLQRSDSLGSRRIDYQLWVHPRRDPGCRVEAAAFLRAHTDRYGHALVVFDHEGSGTREPRDELERRLEDDLARTGWSSGSARVVVIEPELERWVWTASPHTLAFLGWTGSSADLDAELSAAGLERGPEGKPLRPKEAVEHIWKRTRTSKSAARFGKLAGQTSLMACRDASFVRLRDALRAWFPGAG